MRSHSYTLFVLLLAGSMGVRAEVLELKYTTAKNVGFL